MNRQKHGFLITCLYIYSYTSVYPLLIANNHQLHQYCY
ncbi:hypothetical protein FLA_5138 [Filimonas lacunae]|nr:hypothetical protein FLA_5138 [Filimonas lacunae]